MLVLSRKPMESIHIGDSVVVTVLEIRGNKARIGIDAPKEIHVLRSELQEQVSVASGNGSRETVAPKESYTTPAALKLWRQTDLVAKPEDR